MRLSLLHARPARAYEMRNAGTRPRHRRTGGWQAGPGDSGREHRNAPPAARCRTADRPGSAGRPLRLPRPRLRPATPGAVAAVGHSRAVPGRGAAAGPAPAGRPSGPVVGPRDGDRPAGARDVHAARLVRRRLPLPVGRQGATGRHRPLPVPGGGRSSNSCVPRSSFPTGCTARGRSTTAAARSTGPRCARCTRRSPKAPSSWCGWPRWAATGATTRSSWPVASARWPWRGCWPGTRWPGAGRCGRSRSGRGARWSPPSSATTPTSTGWQCCCACSRCSREAVRRSGLAGLLVGAAIATKIYPGLVLVSLLRRRPVPVLGCAAGLVALSYLPHVLAIGPDVLGYLPGYLKEERYTSGGRFLLLQPWLPDPLVTPAAVLLLAVAALWVYRRTDPDAPERLRRAHGRRGDPAQHAVLRLVRAVAAGAGGAVRSAGVAAGRDRAEFLLPHRQRLPPRRRLRLRRLRRCARGHRRPDSGCGGGRPRVASGKFRYSRPVRWHP